MLKSDFYARLVENRFKETLDQQQVKKDEADKVTGKVLVLGDYTYDGSGSDTHFCFAANYVDAKEGSIEIKRSRSFKIREADPTSDEVLYELDNFALSVSKLIKLLG